MTTALSSAALTKAPLKTLQDWITDILSTNLMAAVQGLIQAIAPLMVISLGIWLLLKTWDWSRGKDFNIQTLAQQFIGFLLMMSVGMNATIYGETVQPILKNIGSEIASGMTSATGLSVNALQCKAYAESASRSSYNTSIWNGIFGDNDIKVPPPAPTKPASPSVYTSGASTSDGASQLDGLMLSTIDMASCLMADASYRTFLMEAGTIIADYFKALLVVASVIPLCLVLGYMILKAVFLMNLVIMVGPLFFCLGFFPATRQYFTAWLNACFGLVLVPILAAAMVATSISASATMYVQNGVFDYADVELSSILVYLFLNGMLVLFSFGVSALASQLSAGGVNVGGGGSIMAAAAAIKSMMRTEKSPKNNDGSKNDQNNSISGSDKSKGSPGQSTMQKIGRALNSGAISGSAQLAGMAGMAAGKGAGKMLGGLRGRLSNKFGGGSGNKEWPSKS